jgi:lipid II:glycine glycyltransferase (peptidoglycan interpeptide bridge formation enzyme)
LDARRTMALVKRTMTARPPAVERSAGPRTDPVPPARALGGDGPALVQVSEALPPAQLSEWDELVRSVPLADVAQLSGWARLRRHAGYRAMYVLAYQSGRLAGGAQILVRRVVGLGELGYLAYGPLMSPSAENPAALQVAIVDAVAQLGRERLRLLFVQPPTDAEATSEGLLNRGFRHSEAGIAPRASVRLDLNVDEAQLRRRLSRRLKMNRWDPGGVTVRQSTEEDLPLLAHLLAATSQHQGFTPFGIDYLTTMYEELAPTGDLVGFVGEVAGRPVAMMVLTGCGGVLKRRLVGFDRSEDVLRLNVPAAIDWTALRWAKQRGYLWYDFGGLSQGSVPVVLSGSKVDVNALPGADRYKMCFGGQVFAYPTPVEMIRPAALQKVYDLTRRTTVGRAVVSRAKRGLRVGAIPGARVKVTR